MSTKSKLVPKANRIKKPKHKQTKKKAMVVAEKTTMQPMAAPAAASTVIKTPNNMRYKCTTFERVEAVGPITGSTTAFAVAGNYSINPGLSSLFPWMSAPAAAFNMYKFRKLRIHYKNSTGTTNTGVVVIGFNPDPNDIAPTSLSQIENYETRVRVATWEDSYVDVPKEDLARLKKFLVRTSIVPGELATYDLGSIYIVVSGNNSSSATVGELWLEYILDMYAPITSMSTVPYGKANTVFTQSVPLAYSSGVTLDIPWNTTLANPFGLVNTAGSFTGINGALIVYTQVTITTTAFTNGSIYIYKNGQPVIVGIYPSPTPSAAAGFSTMNVEGFVSLIPTDILKVSVNIIGTGTAAPLPAGSTSVLVLTAA